MLGDAVSCALPAGVELADVGGAVCALRPSVLRALMPMSVSVLGFLVAGWLLRVWELGRLLCVGGVC